MAHAALSPGLQGGATAVLSHLSSLTPAPAKAQGFMAHHDWDDPFFHTQRQFLRRKGKGHSREGHQPMVTALPGPGWDPHGSAGPEEQGDPGLPSTLPAPAISLSCCSVLWSDPQS